MKPTPDVTRCLPLVSVGDINSDPFPMPCSTARPKELYGYSLVTQTSAVFVNASINEEVGSSMLLTTILLSYMRM